MPRARRLGVRERMRADGRVETPLDPRAARPGHRRPPARRRRGGGGLLPPRLPGRAARAGDRARRSAGRCRAPTSRSPRRSCPQIKEYERVCTTVVNAYVGPALSRYLSRLAERLAQTGYAGPVLIIQSHGGVAPVADAVRLAAGAVLSGPGRRRGGEPLLRAAPRRGQPDPLRHGRDQHRHLARRARRGPALAGPGGRGPEGRAPEPRHRVDRRGRRIDRARGRRRHAPRRARRARAPSRARPATARAARPPP